MTLEKRNLPPVSILDCTLRDGGYLNNWDFPIELVKNHVAAVNALGVSMVEVGFRAPHHVTKSFLGQLGHSRPALVESLKKLAPSTSIGVMINASDFDSADEVIRSFREDALLGSLTFVRIATHFTGLSKSLQMAAELRNLGFDTFVNLMQISSVEIAEIQKLGKVPLLGELTGFYVADSFGSMRPTQVRPLIETLVDRFPLPIGAHFHDNLGLAFANSLVAVEAGACLIDGTVLGMGRGAGNTKLEALLLELYPDSDLMTVSLLLDDWRQWADQQVEVTKWGPSLDYALAAVLGVHPTYVQKMIESENYSQMERMKVIEQLGHKDAGKFSESMLDIGREWFEIQGATDPSLRGRFEGKEVLLLGSGESVTRYEDEIIEMCNRQSLVICLVGAQEENPRLRPDYHILSHPMSFLSKPKIFSTGTSKIGPFSQVPKDIMENFEPTEVLSVALALDTESFGFDGETLFVPEPRSSIFALALFMGTGAKSILLAGFDGYRPGDERNHQFDSALRELLLGGKKVFSVTPTSFNVPFRGF